MAFWLTEVIISLKNLQRKLVWWLICRQNNLCPLNSSLFLSVIHSTTLTLFADGIICLTTPHKCTTSITFSQGYFLPNLTIVNCFFPCHVPTAFSLSLFVIPLANASVCMCWWQFQSNCWISGRSFTVNKTRKRHLFERTFTVSLTCLHSHCVNNKECNTAFNGNY